MARPHDRLQRDRPGRFQAQHAPPGVVQKERLHMTLHHKDAALDALLKRQGQRVAMRHYGWSEDEFRARFGKNYI